jgi:hypothetical protein
MASFQFADSAYRYPDSISVLTSNAEVEDWLQSCDSADHVLAMPVRNGYRDLMLLGIDVFKQRMGPKLHFFPNLHCDAFFPFFGYAKNWNGETITHQQCPANPHGDYHDFLAMAIADSRIKWGRVQRLRLKLAAQTQGCLLVKNAKQTIAELYLRSIKMQSTLASERIPWASLCGFTFNHPSARLLNILYASIWSNVLHSERHLFKPIEHEPFAESTVLPVVEFVVRALQKHDPVLDSSCLPRPIYGFESYEQLLKRAVNLYLDEEEIIDMNRSHPKFQLAKQFIRFR